jgi:hypothetical protein
MITDRSWEVRRVVAGAGIALLAWFGGMAALALFVDPVAVVAFGPADRVAQAVVGADASVVGVGRGFVIARADASGLAARLYAGGAWIVWPALARGCGAKRILSSPRVLARGEAG